LLLTTEPFSTSHSPCSSSRNPRKLFSSTNLRINLNPLGDHYKGILEKRRRCYFRGQ
ncbi:unnamed protein product, partial [Musa acuminata subsp. burmannicoides]